MPTSNARVLLARDIHDGIAQDLVAVGYQLDALIARPDVDQCTRSELRDIRLHISQTLANVRRELFELRAGRSALNIELEKLYRTICSEFEGACDVEAVSLSEAAEQLLIECARELLLNAVRHSGGSSIWLRLNSTHNHVLLTISDDGDGRARVTAGRFGLVGVLEKVAELGGQCEISGKRGSTISISLPPLAV